MEDERGRAAAAGASGVGRIVVGGTGRVAVVPDVADVRVGISIVRPTVSLARQHAAATLEAILAAVSDQGVEQRDMRTTDLAIHPRYDHRDGTATLTGYELSNIVEVTIRDITRVGDIIDAALGAGATSLDGLAFRVADASAAEREARRAAVASAQAAADTLASAAGLAIDGVIDIVEGGQGPGPRPLLRAERMLAAADVATPVEGGTTVVAITVTVTFSARPA